MDVENLRLFVLSAELLNISAAGKRLGMAPAVSSAKLAKLERQLGIELLHRSTRKVSLSLEGEEFLPFAQEIIAQEEAAFAALGKGQAKVSGTLRFAAPSTFAQLYIVPIISEFLSQQPGLKLDLKLSDTQFDLIEGSYDLALRNAPLSDTSFKGRKLADDKRVLCASPDYIAQFGSPSKPAELKHHKLIAFRDQHTRALKNGEGATGEFNPSIAQSQLTVDDGWSLKCATLAGVGISLNSLWSVHAELMSGQLVQVLPDFQGADENVLWLIYPKSNVLSPKVRVFIDFLIEQIGREPIWEKQSL